MILDVREERKLVTVWLTNAEKHDPGLRAGLNDIYEKYRKEKYLVAVMESGTGDLYANTLALLNYNKKRAAELEVRRQKFDT